MATTLVDIFDPAIVGDLRDFEVKNIVMAPKYWKKFPGDIHLNWKHEPFGTAHIDSIPDNQYGVYSFVIGGGISGHPACGCLLYVGKAADQSFKNRYAQYLKERKRRRRTDRIKVAWALTQWDGHISFYYAPVPNADANAIDRIESELLKALLPPLNEQFPAEVRDKVKILRG
jgi:hypothetical protein